MIGCFQPELSLQANDPNTHTHQLTYLPAPKHPEVLVAQMLPPPASAATTTAAAQSFTGITAQNSLGTSSCSCSVLPGECLDLPVCRCQLRLACQCSPSCPRQGRTHQRLWPTRRYPRLHLPVKEFVILHQQPPKVQQAWVLGQVPAPPIPG